MADAKDLTFELAFEDTTLNDVVQKLVDEGDFVTMRSYARDQNVDGNIDAADALNRIADIYEHRADIRRYLTNAKNWEVSQHFIERQKQLTEDRLLFDHSEPKPTDLTPQEEMIYAAETQVLQELDVFTTALTTLKDELKEAGRIETEELRKFFDDGPGKSFGYDGSVFIDAELDTHKITEDDLAAHESFINASKVLYEMEEGEALPKNVSTIDGKTIGQWGIDYMSKFENQFYEAGAGAFELLAQNKPQNSSPLGFMHIKDSRIRKTPWRVLSAR